jgi:DNA primase
MGKTYLETIKYLIVADFQVDGLVEKPDVIGAIFGQSEGLLGSQLDIKELQQNGKIGRIEITTSHNNNKTFGLLKLPCSLSMVETVIIGASIESIDKVGPCDTRFTIKKIEDTRGLKRKQIKDRAIDLLGKLMQEEIPDTKELMEEIVDTFKIKEIVLYGPDKLPAGPTIDSNKEIIIVEGRADVITMLKYGFTNVISTGGARIPVSLANICKDKIVTLFLDGDRGADIQQNQLLRSIKVDYIARAPDGKEVEELTQKEINQALRRKIKSTFVLDNNSKKNYSSQPNIVKQTKFSTTNDHKVIASRPTYDNKPKFDPSRRDNKFGDKKTDDFSSMLSNIPDVERIDVSNERSSFRDNNRNNKSSSYPKDRNNFDRNQKYDSSKKPFDNKRNNDSTRKPFENKSTVDTSKKPFENKSTVDTSKKPFDIKSNNDVSKNLNKPSQTKITLKDRLESALKEFDSKSQGVKETVDVKKINSSSKEEVSENKNISDKIKAQEETKPEVKKKKILIKLTDKSKKNFLKILEEVDGKGQSRILNEKLRRIGSSKSSELLGKIKSFKTGKIYAVVTDLEVSSEILNLLKEKDASFIVAPRSKIKDDPEVNIVTYNELKK